MIALAASWSASSARAVELPSGFQDEVVFENMFEPMSFKFAPGGGVFVALKSGKILFFESLTDKTPVLFANLTKEVYDNGDHGALGLVLDPDFPIRPYLYLIYTYDHELGAPAGQVPRWGNASTNYEGDTCPNAGSSCPVSGRVVRLTAEGDHASPNAAAPTEKVLVEGWCQQFGSHSIGDVEFGPEGALFVSGGEGASFTTADYGQFGNPCGDPPAEKAGEEITPPDAEGGALRAQSPLRPDGRVLLNGTLDRIDPETGEGWPGNPFAGSSNANARRIVAFGFRNPFRFSIDRTTDSVFVGNVGWANYEEIDRVPIGAAEAYNSGWPCYEGFGPVRAYEQLGTIACQRLYSTPGSTAAPFFLYDHSAPIAPGDTCTRADGSALAGATFDEGTQFPPGYQDAYFFSDTVRGCIYVMRAEADGEPDPLTTELFAKGRSYTGIDLEEGPEGDLYYSGLDSDIHRIRYDPQAPTAVLAADREWGSTPLEVDFNAGGSSSVEGHGLRYEWDLDGDGVYETTSAGPTVTHTYTNAENVEVSLRVTDTSSGRSSIDRATIYPGDSPPVVTIAQPASNLTWGVGQAISFAGSATDSSGQAIPANGLYWRVRLLHCPFSAADCHEHPLQVFPSVTSGEFVAPDHEYPSYLNVDLTATDARGLSAEKSVKISARPVPLQLQSEPPGIDLTAGDETATAPFQLDAIQGSPTTLVAPEKAALNGSIYFFDGWSDDGARVHTVIAERPATYTAHFIPTTASPLPAPVAPGVPESAETPSTKTTGTPFPARPQRPFPRPRLISGPKHVTSSHRARFVLQEPASAYHCRLDESPYELCLSPRVFRNLKTGPHIFRAQLLDAGGVPTGKVLAYRWTIIAVRD